MNSGLDFETHSDEETRALGRRLAKTLPDSGVVLLIGELGAGKTTLVQGIVEGRGVATAEDVSSPTFTLIHEYGEPVGVYHIDLYRLKTLDEARQFGLEDVLEERVLVLVEWGERFPEILPDQRVEITLIHKGQETRSVQVRHLSHHPETHK